MVTCPKCGNKAYTVWTSGDGKTVAVRCPNTHFHDPRPDVALSNVESNTARKNNIVFLMEVDK